MSAPENRSALLERESEPVPIESPVPAHPTPLSRSRWSGFLLALCLLGGGIAIGRFLPAPPAPSTAAATDAAEQSGPPPRPVETIALSRGNSDRRVTALGQVEPRSRSEIRTRTTGTIQQILVQPGDAVRSGMLVAVLDNADQQLALSQARARLSEAESELARLEAGTRREVIARFRAALESARAREQEAFDNLQRTQALVEQGALSRRSLVEAQTRADAAKGDRLEAAAELAEAEAGPRVEEIAAQRAVVAANRTAVEQAQLVLERTEIRAIATGTVESRIASDGDYLEAGDPILTLASNATLDVFLEIPEELSGQVTPGMAIALSSRALPDWELRAAIAAVIPSADSVSRRGQVRIEIDNPPAALVPGMAVQGEIVLPVETEGFVVPRDALTRRGNRWLVYTVDGSTARELEIELTADLGEQVAIAHPELASGQSVVVRGGDGLRDGAPVNVVTSNS